jgi:antitoxin (DNA-binding transcriptional repressor) of toxin-antitoxin stability system
LELPMIGVGAFEAKTHLSRLLDEVALGETVLITPASAAASADAP